MTDSEPATIIFTAVNHHPEEAGQPPNLRSDERGRYVGYFENEYGEQFLFVYDRASQTGTLWGGDLDWDEPVPVVNGLAVDTVLDEPELMWLLACWRAARR